LVRLALQIDQANGVAGAPRRRGDKFDAERFEPKINLRVHQAAGMNGQEFHLFGTDFSLRKSWEKYTPRDRDKFLLFFASCRRGARILKNTVVAGGVDPGAPRSSIITLAGIDDTGYGNDPEEDHF
jgi:hypothetical protein